MLNSQARFCNRLQRWLQMAHSVQQQWPLTTDPLGKQSPFELKIYSTLLNMGYEAITTFDSDDGLHFIDIALLPQKKLPCKVAIEADGISHFLYEDYRLQNAPHPATRYNTSLQPVLNYALQPLTLPQDRQNVCSHLLCLPCYFCPFHRSSDACNSCSNSHRVR